MSDAVLSNNLLEKILLVPAKEGADTLHIVSGYATATMAYRHFELLKKNNLANVSINLIVGMCTIDGISRKTHMAFKALTEKYSLGLFNCNYLIKPPAIHSKLYVWSKGKDGAIGYIGSGNYTQMGFSGNQREAFSSHSPASLMDYYSAILDQTISCVDNNIADFIEIKENDFQHISEIEEEEEGGIDTSDEESVASTKSPHVRVSFLDRSNRLPPRSGLNWGQRPEYAREPNQAYIRLPADIYNSSFFPVRPIHFTVLTDDDKVLICSRAQDSSKAIHTPHNNSLLGEYFRYRLGLPNGALVELDHLVQYGRTHVDFYRIDEETYYMDFSIDING
ncbi:MAG: NgoFVII family restriction endonuclease [Candidatus Marinimicrobia bacterium]|nr:NgoFVII family restriction endonuclease [Candidatus Neomarinimicrobiota bacterium]